PSWRDACGAGPRGDSGVDPVDGRPPGPTFAYRYLIVTGTVTGTPATPASRRNTTRKSRVPDPANGSAGVSNALDASTCEVATTFSPSSTDTIPLSAATILSRTVSPAFRTVSVGTSLFARKI